ncbi:hypothetical protein ACJQWK_00875 [Exserohilum turcicum]
MIAMLLLMLPSWNQVAFQRSTEGIPDKIVPTLDKLYYEFRTFGALLNAKFGKLQGAVTDSSDLNTQEFNYMSNLRECVQSAADVVSTASTTLNADPSDKISARYGSGFGDVFIRDANEPMLRWFAASTVYEYEDIETAIPAPSETSTGNALTEYQSDTDSDIESDLIRSLFKEAKKRKEQGDLTGAIRHFQNCLKRFSSNTSYASPTATQRFTVCGVSKGELLEHLVDSYCLIGSWGKAKSTMAEKLLITEHQVGKKDEIYLKDTMKLAELMMINQDYVEAHLQGRRSLRGFRKLEKNGHDGYENCLAFLIQISKMEGKVDEEEAYTALLVGHARALERSVPEFQSTMSYPNAVQLQPSSNPGFGARLEMTINVSEQMQEAPLQSKLMSQEAPSSASSEMYSSPPPQHPPGDDVGTADLGLMDEQDVRSLEMEELKSSKSRDQDEQFHPAPEDFVLYYTPNHIKTTMPNRELSILSYIAVQGDTLDKVNVDQESKSNKEKPYVLDTPLHEPMEMHHMGNPEQFDREELVRNPTIETGELRKKVYPITESLGAATNNGTTVGPATLTDCVSVTAKNSRMKGLVEPLAEDEKPIMLGQEPSFTIYPPLSTGCTPAAVATLERVPKECYRLPSPIYGSGHPGGVIESQCILNRVAREDNAKLNKEGDMTSIDFLKEYCKMYGQEPRYTTYRSLSGFTCTVRISNTQHCTVSGYLTDHQANNAAAAKACRTYISARDTDIVMRILGRPDSDSDKEVYTPISTEEETTKTAYSPFGNTSAMPRILFTEDTQNIEAISNISSLQQSSFDSSDQATGQRLLGKIRGIPFAAFKSAASLHMPRLGFFMPTQNPSDRDPPKYLSTCPFCDKNMSGFSETACNVHLAICTTNSDGGSSVFSKVAQCPFCKISLSKMTEDACLLHVNSCRDTKSVSTGVTQPSGQQNGNLGSSVSSWSPSSIITPTEGTWACHWCKSDRLQYLHETQCRVCSVSRHSLSPSSINGFNRLPWDRFQSSPKPSHILIKQVTPKTINRRKIVLLGDTMCGKTYLASTWSKDQCLDSEASVMNHFIKSVAIESCQVELVIWDNTGINENDRLRRLSYKDVHMLLICFDISDPDSFENVEYMWNAEAAQFLARVPKVLVGCKKDLRNSTQTLSRLRRQDMMPISPYAANKLAIRIGALAYFETSAVEKQGLSDLFEYVAKTALEISPKSGLSGIRGALSKIEIKSSSELK